MLSSFLSPLLSKQLIWGGDGGRGGEESRFGLVGFSIPPPPPPSFLPLLPPAATEEETGGVGKEAWEIFFGGWLLGRELSTGRHHQVGMTFDNFKKIQFAPISISQVCELFLDNVLLGN